jgi:2'-5' RNA ligase
VVPPLIRSFVAVPAGEQLRAELDRRLDDLRGRVAVRWTRPETWHLTLQFLGDWPPERLDALAEALRGVSGREPWPLTPAGLGGFPDVARARVLFLQMEDDGRIADLARDVRSTVAAAWPEGPQDTKAFRPHLTLARVRDRLEPRDVKMLRNIDLSDLPPLPVEGVGLMASELDPQGARHRMLSWQGLRKKGE